MKPDRLFVLALLLAHALAVPAARAAKPEVAVTVEIVDVKYRTNWNAAARANVESRLASLVANELSCRLGFVTFSPGKAGPAYTLALRLEGSVDAPVDVPREVGLRTSLSGPDLHRGEDGYFLPLFPKEAYAGSRVGTDEEFLRAVQTKLRAALEREATSDLVSRVLSRIPVGASGKLIARPWGLILPFRRADVCLPDESRLRVKARVMKEIGPKDELFGALVSQEYDPPPGAVAWEALRKNLFAEPESADAVKRAVANPEAATVVGVYVVEPAGGPTEGCGCPTPGRIP